MRDALVPGVLRTPQEILAAKALLFSVYTVEMGWVPGAENPSGIRRETVAGIPVLEDAFTSTSTWFGVKCSGRVVACLRALQPFGGLLEVEAHRSLPLPLKMARARSFEVNRLCVAPEFRTSTATALLFREAALHLATRDVAYVLTTASPAMEPLLLKLGFVSTDGGMFRYHPADPEPVKLLHLECSAGGALERIIGITAQLVGG